MGIFDKQEKKLRKELGKKNAAFCRDAVKELEELHDELKAAYAEIDIMEEFVKFKEDAAARLNKEDNAKLEHFLVRFKAIDKYARDAVRDVRDVLRGQRKRLREAEHDE